MSNRFLDIKYFDELTGAWGLRKPPSAPSALPAMNDVRMVTIVVGASSAATASGEVIPSPAGRAMAIVDILESAAASVAVLSEIDEAVYDAVKADARVRSKFATTDLVVETPAVGGARIGTMLLWQPLIGVQLVESPMKYMKGRPALMMNVRQFCGGPCVFVAAWFGEGSSRAERASLLLDSVLAKVHDPEKTTAVVVGCNWPRTADSGATGRVEEIPVPQMNYTIAGGAEADPAGILVNNCHLRFSHTIPVPRKFTNAPLRSVLLASLGPAATPSTSPVSETNTPPMSTTAQAPPAAVTSTQGGGATRAAPQTSPPLAPVVASAAAGAGKQQPPSKSKGSPPPPPTLTPPTISPSANQAAPPPGAKWPSSPPIPLPASQQAALRSQQSGNTTSPLLHASTSSNPTTAPGGLSMGPAALPHQPPPSYRSSTGSAVSPGGSNSSPNTPAVASPQNVAPGAAAAVSAPLSAAPPQWSVSHAIKQVPKIDGLNDLDVTSMTSSLEDAVKQLNSGSLQRWPWDYAIAHGRLLGTINASLDTAVVRGFVAGRKAAAAAAASASGSGGNRRGAQAASPATAAAPAAVSFSMVSPHDPAIKARLATPLSMSGNGPQQWSVLQSAPLYQVSPAEMRVFDISRAVGTGANVLHVAVERLKQAAMATAGGSSGSAAAPAGGPLDRYPHDYAIVFHPERQCYVMLATSQVPCEPSACRAAALAYLNREA